MLGGGKLNSQSTASPSLSLNSRAFGAKRPSPHHKQPRRATTSDANHPPTRQPPFASSNKEVGDGQPRRVSTTIPKRDHDDLPKRRSRVDGSKQREVLQPQACLRITHDGLDTPSRLNRPRIATSHPTDETARFEFDLIGFKLDPFASLNRVQSPFHLRARQGRGFRGRFAFAAAR